MTLLISKIFKMKNFFVTASILYLLGIKIFAFGFLVEEMSKFVSLPHQGKLWKRAGSIFQQSVVLLIGR